MEQLSSRYFSREAYLAELASKNQDVQMSYPQTSKMGKVQFQENYPANNSGDYGFKYKVYRVPNIPDGHSQRLQPAQKSNMSPSSYKAKVRYASAPSEKMQQNMYNHQNMNSYPNYQSGQQNSQEVSNLSAAIAALSLAHAAIAAKHAPCCLETSQQISNRAANYVNRSLPERTNQGRQMEFIQNAQTIPQQPQSNIPCQCTQHMMQQNQTIPQFEICIEPQMMQQSQMGQQPEIMRQQLMMQQAQMLQPIDVKVKRVQGNQQPRMMQQPQIVQPNDVKVKPVRRARQQQMKSQAITDIDPCEMTRILQMQYASSPATPSTAIIPMEQFSTLPQSSW